MTEGNSYRDIPVLQIEPQGTTSNSSEALHANSTLIDTTEPSQPAFPTPQTTSPPPANLETRPQTTPPTHEEQTPANPQLSSLHAMFPDYDDAILISVLQSVNGSEERAIDALLLMSDPEYKSEATPQPQERALTQTELDEQLARRLMLEDQEQHQQQWIAQNPQRPQTQRRNSRPLQQQPSSGGDSMGAEFQEQFSKMAETGKKTFGTLFSKVKAKLQEFDQPKPTQGSVGSSSQPSWVGNQGQQPYYAQQQNTAPASQPAYYDPNPPSTSPTLVHSDYTSTPASVQGYDVTPMTSSMPVPGSDAPRPPVTGRGTPIDAGKLGLLPKRPVSLLRDPAPASNSANTAQESPRRESEDVDGGLEYAESPFEDRRK